MGRCPGGLATRSLTIWRMKRESKSFKAKGRVQPRLSSFLYCTLFALPSLRVYTLHRSCLVPMNNIASLMKPFSPWGVHLHICPSEKKWTEMAQSRKRKKKNIKMKEESHQRCEMKWKKWRRGWLKVDNLHYVETLKASNLKLVGAEDAQILLGYSEENLARSWSWHFRNLVALDCAFTDSESPNAVLSFMELEWSWLVWSQGAHKSHVVLDTLGNAVEWTLWFSIHLARHKRNTFQEHVIPWRHSVQGVLRITIVIIDRLLTSWRILIVEHQEEFCL